MQQTFFFQAMVYLAAAVVMVPIAKKLGLGSVLGYLIAGVLIGPYCLRFIGQEGTDIMHFAEFGVVMMLFVIGLELEPSRLWRLRQSILGMGGTQIGLTALVVTGLALLGGLVWQQALVLGLIVAMSSTAIVLQSLNEKGLMQTAAGQSSFAVLLFQDIAVIPMLALFPLLATQPLPPAAPGDHHDPTLIASLPTWAQPFVVLGAVAAIIVAGQCLTPPLFRIIARTGMRELFTATALLLVVSIAVLMSTVGLSPALGTFLAGVVLANSEYRHELESDIDPFKGLLLGLFFIAVGASIDFRLILASPLLVLGLVAGLMLCKLLVLTLIGRIFRLSTPQNLIFSFGLCQIGEFAFVLFSFTAQEGVLPKPLTDLMTAVVALSMAFTPLAQLLNEKGLLPRLGVPTADEQESDVESEDNPVIIAGYGHFGTTVGRFLQANGIGTTVLDSDSDNVTWLRRMGFKVYYGDASRHDLLDIAGAAKAKLIIIAIDDAARRLELVETVKKHFPDLHILVRATNRYDAYDLMNAGVLHIYRETLDTSLRVGVDTLTLLGHRAHESARAAKMFFRHDEHTLKRLSAIRNEEEYISAARETTEELDRIMQADRNGLGMQTDEGWDDTSLVNDASRRLD